MGARVLNLRNWLTRAECRGADFDFVPTTETARGLAAAQQWCNLCPVREECLMTALRNSAWTGYWGGTTTAERSKLKAAKRRVKCPVCLSITLIDLDDSQVCIACGRSWRNGREPAVKHQKRPSEKTADPQQKEVTVVGDVL